MQSWARIFHCHTTTDEVQGLRRACMHGHSIAIRVGGFISIVRCRSLWSKVLVRWLVRGIMKRERALQGLALSTWSMKCIAISLKHSLLVESCLWPRTLGLRFYAHQPLKEHRLAVGCPNAKHWPMQATEEEQAGPKRIRAGVQVQLLKRTDKAPRVLGC